MMSLERLKTEERLRETTMTLQATTQAPITEKQVAFIADLVAKRDWRSSDDEIFVKVCSYPVDEMTRTMTRATASKLIDMLLACRPIRPTSAADDALAAVKNVGVKFALPKKDGSGITFFEIVERKNGRRFVNMLVGHPGSWLRQNISVAMQQAAARAFHADEKAAMNLYADEFTVCSKCDSPLSDERSRAARLGPVCAGNLGYTW